MLKLIFFPLLIHKKELFYFYAFYYLDYPISIEIFVKTFHSLLLTTLDTQTQTRGKNCKLRHKSELLMRQNNFQNTN